MKPPKDQKPSIEQQIQQLIIKIDKIDLSRFSIQLNKMKEYRKLVAACEYEAADDFYLTTVMNAMFESDLEEFQEDVIKFRYKTRGKNRGKQKTVEANKIKKWLYPLLAECEAEFPPERKNRGWVTMKNKAIKKITKDNLDDTRKKYITRARIQTWIDEGRPKNLPS